MRTSNPADKLLPLLKGVRKSGASSYMSLCPAHEDKKPSLSVRIFDDGSISVKCFTGCHTASILGALGLEPSDLFPRHGGEEHAFRPVQKVPQWRTSLSYLREDLVAVQIGAARMAAGDELPEEDLDRIGTAALRIWSALDGLR